MSYFLHEFNRYYILFYTSFFINAFYSEDVYCADPGRIEHGSHIDADGSNSLPSSRYLHGQSVFYSCAEGFEPVGNTTLTCLPSGWWSSLPPFCRQVFIEITRPTGEFPDS
ncbi:hypothetical protein AVEN_132363-1 [Araneus ventricosus]|uniref:Sushi domain-containing protein n=1 Tax=Araneus ventricosus TaxID=182803 RepID=A0A4Y2XDM2_ARAVE|nr:hypothetical protein AVEN_132363-1 [Araneus ventricosus]